MFIEIVGPYYDNITGKTVDVDLLRIVLSKHRVSKESPNGRMFIGHCRPSDKSVLIFPNVELNDREKADAYEWTRELLNDSEHNWPEYRADSKV